jgi:acyl-[acyl-carrier-protein] desaturase
VSLERARMAQVQGGQAPEPPNALEGLAYVTLQELATRISHFNTGQHLTDSAGKAIMRRVAFDENLHFLFYRDAMGAALEMEPSAAVVAIANQVKGFAMPGVGIDGFDAHARTIAEAGIYDLSIHHDQILEPVLLRHWQLPTLTGLSGVAEAARDRLMKFIDRIGRVGRLMVERRAERRARGPQDRGLERLLRRGHA